MNWIPTINFSKMSTALIPTISVLFPYYDDQVAIFENNTNGLAAGSNFHESILQGIYFVVKHF